MKTNAGNPKNTELYDELGVGAEASEQDVKKAYRRRARETHPDSGGSEEAFAKTSLAYRILKDPNSRAKYDATGEVDDESSLNVELPGVRSLARAYEEAVVTASSSNPISKLFGGPPQFRQHTTTSLTVAVVAALKRNEKSVTDDIESLHKEAARLDNYLNRLVFKEASSDGGPPDLLKGIITGQKQSIDNLIKIAHETIEDIQAALEYMTKYDYKVTEPPASPFDGKVQGESANTIMDDVDVDVDMDEDDGDPNDATTTTPNKVRQRFEELSRRGVPTE